MSLKSPFIPFYWTKELRFPCDFTAIRHLLNSIVMRIGWIVPTWALLLTIPSVLSAQPSPPFVTVGLPGKPFGVVVSQDQQWVFVSFASKRPGQTQGIAVLRAQEGQFKIQRVVAMSRQPAGIVLTHDGKLLIAAAKDYVVFFDTHRLITGESAPAFQWISDGAKASSVDVNVTADDKTLFVSDEFARAITVIDLDIVRAQGYDSAENLQRLNIQGGGSAAVVGRIPVGISPVAMTFSPDQHWLYTTSEVAAPSWRWPKVFTEENSDTSQESQKVPEGAVIVVDVAKARVNARKSVIARIPAGGSPVRLALSPDGGRLFVSARNSNAVLVFDTTKFFTDPLHAKLATIPVGKSPVPIVLVDDGKIAIIGNSNRYGVNANVSSTLSVLDTTKIGTALNPIIGSIPAGAYPRNFCLSPDGQTLFLVNFISGSLQIMEVSSLPHP
jgi:DNA-binding beta-propeller fold protein YncE